MCRSVRLTVVCLLALAARPAQAQFPLDPRGLPPSAGKVETSTYGQHEAARRQRIGQQIGLQDYVRWQAGLPPRQAGAIQPSLDYLYSGAAYGPPTGWPTPFIFEPWPFVPGDIYGAPYAPSVPQPTGYEITPTGPNGYVYRPMYSAAPPIVSVPPVPVPPSTRRVEPRPAEAEELPPPSPSRLREF